MWEIPICSLLVDIKVYQELETRRYLIIFTWYIKLILLTRNRKLRVYKRDKLRPVLNFHKRKK